MTAEVEAKRWQGFMVRPDGQISEITPDGEEDRWWTAPGLFDTLVLAGYPLHRDPDLGRWDGVLDLSVDPDDPSEVTAYTVGTEPREHQMGAASELFLDWYRREVQP